MKVEIAKESLDRALGLVASLSKIRAGRKPEDQKIEPRSSLPFKIRLRAEGEHVEVSAFNKSPAIYVKARMAAAVEEKGDAIADGVQLHNLISLVDDVVQLSANRRLQFRSGKTTGSLPLFVEDELLFFDNEDTDYEIVARLDNAASLRALLNAVTRCLSREPDEGNSLFTTVGLFGRDKRVKALATNRHMLGISEAENIETRNDFKVYLSREVVSVVQYFLANIEGPLELGLGIAARQFLVKSSIVELAVPVTSVTLPSLREILDTSGFHRALVPSGPLIKSIKKLLVVSSRPQALGSFTLFKDRIEVKLNDKGEIMDVVEAECDGPELTIGFNLNYVKTALADSKRMEIKYRAPSERTFWRPIDHPCRVQFVVMPART